MRSLVTILSLILTSSVALASESVYVKGTLSLDGITQSGAISNLLVQRDFEYYTSLADDNLGAGMSPSSSAFYTITFDSIGYPKDSMTPIFVKSTDVQVQIQIQKQFSPGSDAIYTATVQFVSTKSPNFTEGNLVPDVVSTTVQSTGLMKNGILAANQSIKLKAFGYSVLSQEPGSFSYGGANKDPIKTVNPSLTIERIQIAK